MAKTFSGTMKKFYTKKSKKKGKKKTTSLALLPQFTALEDRILRVLKAEKWTAREIGGRFSPFKIKDPTGWARKKLAVFLEWGLVRRKFVLRKYEGHMGQKVYHYSLTELGEKYLKALESFKK